VTTDLLVLPRVESDTLDLSGAKGSLFWKKILPFGEITYDGKRLRFDRQYAVDLTTSFRDGVFDQLAFILDKGDGKHTIDPERQRGEFVDLAVRDDGLYGALKPANDAAAQLIRDNPKMGVSPRIFENLTHATGKFAKRAMHHVLGTLDPRIPGMGTWQEVVSLSAESVDNTVDLSAATWGPLGEEGSVAGTEDTQAEGTEEGQQGSAEGGDTNDGEYLTDADRQLAEQIASGTEGTGGTDDADTEDDADAAGSTDGTNTEEVSTTTETRTAQRRTDLSGGTEDTTQIDLTRVVEAQGAQLRQMQIDLARERFDGEARTLIADGVPPVLVDLARPFLTLPATHVSVVDLSRGADGEALPNIQETLRKMLAEFKGFLDLSRGEQGTNWAADGKDPEDAILEAWERTG